MENNGKRWRGFFIALIIELFGGFLYAWSVVQLPLEQKYGWSSSAISLAYTLNFLVTALVTLFGGKLKDKMGIRRTALAGGLFTGAGLLMCSFIQGQIWQLYLGFSVLYGIGVAFISPALVAYCVQILPGRSGLAGGASSGAFALGALIWAPAATRILEWKGDVSDSFLYLGLLMMVPIVVLSFFLVEVPDSPAAPAEGKGEPASTGLLSMGRGQMLRTASFYAIAVTFILGLSCGAMVMSYGAPILQTAFPTVSADMASLLVGVFSIMSAVGRVFWGTLSDKLGKLKTLLLLAIVTGVSMAVLILVPGLSLYVAMLVLATLCYGGFCCIVGPLTAEVYGQEHFKENYSVIYMVYTIASLIGPVLISAVRDATGELSGAYVVGLIFCVLGVIIALCLLGWASRKRAQARA